ncbi:hypothetical protein [Faecalibacillus faecis]|uniref:hypothetical protein n=1 Tax=Faecalibacillus faecis TaxID=1982628 RepID=UPI00387033E9
MEQIIKIILNWAIPVILAGILVFMKKMINDMKAMKLSQLSLIRSQIVSKCESYMKKGFLPEYARYCLEDLFKQYKILGGNHGIEKLVDKTFELPSANEKEG